ncbi:CD48 antigen-like [Colossoma macropomum]|uniref:CD48 antigen-like n=1 Tax=Colossoma macropomum TaxID=42526 RepID=UPI0018647135|nr:CD48 antigen-like [Colossoma macropomum]XP_036438992.1 CD48 antigen-like [Colossoma macropomum]
MKSALLCSAGGEAVRLQELEGNTVTIHTGLTGVQSDAQILWFYGPENKKIVNSLVIKGETKPFYDSERFRDRLQLNRNSGSLTITNISREDSGVYKLQIITENRSNWIYRIEVYAPAPTPTISLKKKHTFPREICVLVCSVENGKDVNLSWYEEKERISTTNSTDFSGNISLPLNITNPNNSTYTCVAANPVNNQTTPLNITELCYTNTDSKSMVLIAVLTPVGLIAVAVFAVAGACYWKKKTRRGSSAPERYNGIKYSPGSQQNDTQPCEPSVSFESEIV